MITDSEVAIDRAEPRFRVDKIRSFLTEAARIFADKPFKPHPVFTGGHAQTLASFAWPRRRRLRSQTDEERLFAVGPNTKILAHCRWHAHRAEHPTIVLWHGIEGSSNAVYMLATAQKAFRAGFNVMRMNLRNCGGTEHLTPTLYHGGLSEDLRAVVKELNERDRLSRLFLIGFSLGGNMVLKLAGEYGEHPPKEIVAVCAISPSVDLGASGDLIGERSNWIYHRDFVRRLKKRIKLKGKLYPEIYDTRGVHLVHSIREFDERFTSVAHGFANAADYYDKASALRVMDKIRVPTLIIHAHDDPFIPFAPLRDPSVGANPYILLLGPERGGHVAFLAAKRSPADPDLFWAENRVLEFCKLAQLSF
ncbi:MAG: alpha/beta fold hydrolase [Pyrinomonadaceae bacterium]|nr:alpha/beta fold hydrolase [Pyrinomonadaceae bacterium]